VTDSRIDYRAVYRRLPAGIALLDEDLRFIDVNEEYERLSGRSRDALIGNRITDAFPANPHEPDSDGVRNVPVSLRNAFENAERDTLGLQRYDIERPDRPGTFEERYWSVINIPVTHPDGSVMAVIHRVEDITSFVHTRGQVDHLGQEALDVEAELFLRARELQEVNHRLRRAHAREREAALAFQNAMLPAPRPVSHRSAVRYRPAVDSLNVCGDWYDLVDLPDGRMAVAVGDVVGHGLDAACVMGQLRSALSAASHVAAGPALAMETLGLYAKTVDGAESTTAVVAFIDWGPRLITYTSAGHPPPALVHPDGRVEFLDKATDPPLNTLLDHEQRPQSVTFFAADSSLVLYTDGLIERRGEDIDVGLRRLCDSLERHHHLECEQMADAVLTDLIPPAGATDDTALVIVRL
jgi:PAS domain S-box-containing protein